MRRGIVGGAGLLALALTFGRDAKAANALFEFQTIGVPGTLMTIAWGINPQGDIVGQYRDTAGRFHGYLLGRDGRVTTIDYPGAAWTDARGINADGDIVGSYSSRPAGPGAINEVHGYVKIGRASCRERV